MSKIKSIKRFFLKDNLFERIVSIFIDKNKKNNLENQKFIVREDGSIFLNKENKEVQESFHKNIKALSTLKVNN